MSPTETFDLTRHFLEIKGEEKVPKRKQVKKKRKKKVDHVPILSPFEKLVGVGRVDRASV